MKYIADTCIVGATSSKALILAAPTQPDHDVDYLFGQVSIDKPFVDWSGNCGNLIDDLEVPGLGSLQATMINAGIPTIFLNAEAIGFKGTELQDDINNDPGVL